MSTSQQTTEGDGPAAAGHHRNAALIVADLKQLMGHFQTGQATVEGSGGPAKRLSGAIDALYRACDQARPSLHAVAEGCRAIKKAWPSGGGVSIGGPLCRQVRSESTTLFNEATNHPDFQHRDAAEIVADLKELMGNFQNGDTTVGGDETFAQPLREAIEMLYLICEESPLTPSSVAEACRDVLSAWPDSGEVSIAGKHRRQIRKQSITLFEEVAKHPEFQG